MKYHLSLLTMVVVCLNSTASNAADYGYGSDPWSPPSYGGAPWGNGYGAGYGRSAPWGGGQYDSSPSYPYQSSANANSWNRGSPNTQGYGSGMDYYGGGPSSYRGSEYGSAAGGSGYSGGSSYYGGRSPDYDRDSYGYGARSDRDSGYGGYAGSRNRPTYGGSGYDSAPRDSGSQAYGSKYNDPNVGSSYNERRPPSGRNDGDANSRGYGSHSWEGSSGGSIYGSSSGYPGGSRGYGDSYNYGNTRSTDLGNNQNNQNNQNNSNNPNPSYGSGDQDKKDFGFNTQPGASNAGTYAPWSFSGETGSGLIPSPVGGPVASTPDKESVTNSGAAAEIK